MRVDTGVVVELETILCLLNDHDLWFGAGCCELEHQWLMAHIGRIDGDWKRELQEELLRQFPRLAEAEAPSALRSMLPGQHKRDAVVEWTRQVAEHTGYGDTVEVHIVSRTIPPTAHDGEARR